MNFRSDNTAPAAPEIIAALSNVNSGAASAYGEDQWSKRLDAAFGALVERDVRVLTVASGTAANAISVATLTPPWGAVLCHREAVSELTDLNNREFVFLVILAVCVLAMGIYPYPITEVMHASVNDLLKHVSASKL